MSHEERPLLTTLPNKLATTILSNLGARDLCAYEQVSKEVREQVLNSGVWDAKLSRFLQWPDKLLAGTDPSEETTVIPGKEGARQLYYTLRPRLNSFVSQVQGDGLKSNDDAVQAQNLVVEFFKLSRFAGEFYPDQIDSFQDTVITSIDKQLLSNLPAVTKSFLALDKAISVTTLQQIFEQIAQVLTSQARLIDIAGQALNESLQNTRIRRTALGSKFERTCQEIAETQLSSPLLLAISNLQNDKDQRPYLEGFPVIWETVQQFVQTIHLPECAPTDQIRFQAALMSHFVSILPFDDYMSTEKTAVAAEMKNAILSWHFETDTADEEMEVRITGQSSATRSSQSDLSAKTSQINLTDDFYGDTLTSKNEHAINWNSAEILTTFRKMLQVQNYSFIPKTATASDASTGNSMNPRAMLQGLPGFFKKDTTPIQPRWKEKDSFSELDHTMALESIQATMIHSYPSTTSNTIKPRDPETVALKLLTYKLGGIRTTFSLELVLSILDQARTSVTRLARVHAFKPYQNVQLSLQEGLHNSDSIKALCQKAIEDIYVDTITQICNTHLRIGFSKVLAVMSEYKSFHALIKGLEIKIKVQPLVEFTQLTSVADLIYQMAHEFQVTELQTSGIYSRDSQLTGPFKAKRAMEREIDMWVGRGFGIGIEIVMEEISKLLAKSYKVYAGVAKEKEAQWTAQQVVEVLKTNSGLLVNSSSDSTVFDIYQQELLLRFFGLLTNFLKRQPSIAIPRGAQSLCADVDFYSQFIHTLPHPNLVRNLQPHFTALSNVCKVFETKDPAEIAKILKNEKDYVVAFQPEEAASLVKARDDWPKLRKEVTELMKGKECIIM